MLIGLARHSEVIVATVVGIARTGNWHDGHDPRQGTITRKLTLVTHLPVVESVNLHDITMNAATTSAGSIRAQYARSVTTGMAPHAMAWSPESGTASDCKC